MKCNLWGVEEATVHLTVIAEGKPLRVDLCQACAAKKGVNDPTGFSLAELLRAVKAAQNQKKPQ